jgi:predicted methyltransferase
MSDYDAILLPRTTQELLENDKKLGLGVRGIYGIGYPQVPANGAVEAHGATDTIVAADFGKNNTNTGASGTTVHTLPAAASHPGQVIRFTALAAQIMQIDPATGEAVWLNGSGVVSKYVQVAGVIGNYIDLWCDGLGYHVVGYAGVVTKEA